jgi:hypothetical protein
VAHIVNYEPRKEIVLAKRVVGNDRMNTLEVGTSSDAYGKAQSSLTLGDAYKKHS